MSTFRNILIADDEPSIRHVLSVSLKQAGYDVRAVSNGEEAMAELRARAFDVLITDVRMPRLGGLELVDSALAHAPELTIIVMSAYGAPEQALDAVRRGAFDYLSKPFKPDELVLVLRKAEERRRLVRENQRLRVGPDQKIGLGRLLGQSAAMENVRKQITRLAPAQTTILISGESGTGKELAAKALHELSPRAAMPFVPVNCGAIPPSLIESELFGHKRGAFTDAKTDKAGLFLEADGGTLFLDEVAELPLAAQVKLLRFLQEGEVRRVGETEVEKVDVRIVAATWRDVAKMVEKGEFREDLFYRLNVVQLELPPLRARTADISELATLFLARFNAQLSRERAVVSIGAAAHEAMLSYAWPGNIRELENALERAVLLSDGPELSLRDLPEKIWSQRTVVTTPSTPAAANASNADAGGSLSLKRAISELEESYIRAALRRTRGNRTRAAELLEISHRALLYKIKDYAIDPDEEGSRS